MATKTKATKTETKSTKAAKKTTPAPAPTEPKKEAKAPRASAPKVPGTAKITLVRKDNPKRGASADRYKLYKTGMTVDEYVKAGGFRADIAWDLQRDFIKVG